MLCAAQTPLASVHRPTAEALALLGEQAQRALEWPMGLVCFWSAERQVWVLPPFAIRQAGVEATWHSPTFHALYSRPVSFGLLLLRRGGYALGIAQGESLEVHKVGSRYVHGRHRAGGSSARRFERRRREQVHHLLEEVCQEATARLGERLSSLEAIFFGGDRLLLRQLEKECPFLGRVKPLVHPHHLPVPEPRLKVLEDAVGLAWQSQVALTGCWEGGC
ncbi:MAG: acVLRF1 family peptidyl-tRNA hydrolase [Dehalococcoidia bacterium]|nr:acVLRF1 family peptidyl-tRNA hydrolase [Dehalococcoidia bacterium]MDW8120456.1 acVLRF1 family peptidyl-tRNA hydrolase [Chloroflexota bacterium]